MSKWSKQFVKLFGAHFKITFREKQVWFWSIFYPVLLLVIFMMIFGGGSSEDFKVKAVLVEPSANPSSTGVRQALESIEMLIWEEETPVELIAAEQLLKDKEVDAVIVLPSSDAGAGGELKLLLNREKQNSAAAQAITVILNNIIMQMAGGMDEASEQEPRLTLLTDYISAGSDKLQYNDFLLTGMMALSISQAGLFGMIGMVEMRRNGLLKRLAMTPIQMRTFGISGMGVRMILSIIQIVLLSIIGVLAFNANLNIHPAAFIVTFVIGTLSFSGMGFMIAAFSKSVDSYMGIANLLSFLMMFVSGIFFDLAMLPTYIQPIAAFMPLTYFANGIRDGFVYGIGFNEAFWSNNGILAAWGLVTFLIGSRFYKWKA